MPVGSLYTVFKCNSINMSLENEHKGDQELNVFNSMSRAHIP